MELNWDVTLSLRITINNSISKSANKKDSIGGLNNGLRENLLNSYQNGGALTQQEMKFLANTSSLINKGIDK